MSCVICYEKLFGDTGNSGTGASSSSSNTPTNAGSDGECKLSALHCGHVFHQSCIGDWLGQSRGKTCPVCRHKQNGSPLALFFEEDDGNDASLEAIQHIHDTREETSRLHEMLETLTETVSALQEGNSNLQEQYEELQARYSVRDFEFTAEVETTTQLRNQARELNSQLQQRAARIGELQEEIARKDGDIQQFESRVAALQADIMEKSWSIDIKNEEVKTCKTRMERAQREYDDLLPKYNDRVVQVESLETQLAASRELSAQHQSRILELDEIAAGKDAEIAQLQLSVQEKTLANTTLEAKMQTASAEVRFLQDQYSSLFMNYATREFDYVAEVTKSQQLSQEAAAAIDQRMQLERKTTELNVAIAENESQIRLLRLQLQDSRRVPNGTGADGAMQSEIRELQEQYGELESKYVARYAEYKKELTKSQTLAAELASTNSLVAQRDQQIRVLERTVREKVAEIDLLQCNLDELTVNE
ncbi:hypothetical protein GQ54DRAFT_300716 [Martensiomyces pterosporus]|nr:hypothetical protein GQ54DRAFT_300716 [Martensiomyces pterosporus]